jgi:trigger factor
LKLEVAVTDISQVKKDLTIEVAAEEVKAEFDKTYEAYSRYAKVPGFRPGRVPIGVVKQRFGKDVKDEVLGRLLPHALQHALSDNKLNVVGEPSLNDVSINEGDPLVFKISVEVIPDFEIGEYKGLKAVKRIAVIKDEDVDRVIDRWRQSQAEFVAVEDRPSQDGDFVSVNLVGKYVDAPDETEDLIADDVQIELGAEGVQHEFNENLQGAFAGTVREFRIAYPEDFGSKGLAGKTLDFRAEVVAVRRKELAEVDDEFAKEVGYESVQDMRDKVRQNLETGAERDADVKLRDDLLEQILKPYTFEIPDSLVEQQATDRTRELAYMMLRGGVAPNSLKDFNWEERLKEARILAVRDVRAAIVVGRIAEIEGITVGPADIDAEIERMAPSSGETPEQLKARLTKDDTLSSIESRLRFQKSLDRVINTAEVTVEELVETQESPQASPDATSTGEDAAQ